MILLFFLILICICLGIYMFRLIHEALFGISNFYYIYNHHNDHNFQHLKAQLKDKQDTHNMT